MAIAEYYYNKKLIKKTFDSLHIINTFKSIKTKFSKHIIKSFFKLMNGLNFNKIKMNNIKSDFGMLIKKKYLEM